MAMNRCASHRCSSSVCTLLLGLVFLLSLLTLSQAQVPVPVVTNIQATTGGSLDLGTIAAPSPTVATTTQITGGTRPNNGTDPGTNLFHSFDFFTLGTGDTAHFLNDMELPTENIIARVIGGEVSTIDGTLRTNNPLEPADPMNFGAANLWLVNPSGLLLGPNARVEVGGSVSMSTANYLRFESQTALFDMLSTPASLGLLDVAPVVAFGFTGPEPPAPILFTVQGSMLQVPEGQALSLVGRDITVQAGSLRAPGGQINLVSVASPGEVLVPSFQTGPNIDGVSFSTMGTVTIKEGATLDVSGQLDEFGTPIGNGKGGTVFVRGGSLIVNNSTIEAKTLGDLDGDNPGIDLSLTDIVTLTNGATLSVATGDFSMGRPGDVRITTSNLELSQGATIKTTGSSGLAGLGAAADILLNVNSLSLTGGSEIFSNTIDVPGGNITIRGFEGTDTAAETVLVAGTAPTGLPSKIHTETQGVGTGGKLSVSTGSLTLDDQGKITSATFFGNGQGGEIVLNVEKSVTVSNGASIKSETDNFFDVDQGVGGNVTIQGLGGSGTSAGSVTVSGQDSLGTPSGIFSGSIFGIARSGSILVDTSTYTLSDGAVVQSGSPFDFSAGGSITVRASDSVNISNGSSISNQALAAPAGPVSITTSALTINNGSINTSTLSNGPAGDVIINARNVRLTNGSRIESSTADVGAAGSVVIQGQGGEGTRANDVTIRGQDATGQPGGLFTNTGKAGIFENPAADGAGGNIKVVTNTFTLEGGASISAASSSISPLAKGGSITVDANLATVRTGAFITSESIRTTGEGGAAPGGDVGITAQALKLDLGSISAATAGSGEGGSITVNTTGGAVSLANGSRISSASTGTTAVTNPDGTTQAPGAAGNVVITAAGSFTSDASTVATSAEANHSGDISITAQSVQLSGGTSITASSKAPLKVTEFILDNDGTLVEQEVGNGNAGNITIHSGSNVVMNNSSMTTEASRASGGEIEITAPEMVRLINSHVSTSVAGSLADTAGGNIMIDPQFVILQNSQIIARAFAGSGGAINITAGVFLADPSSIVDASSTLGISGTVNIQSPVQNVGGRLTPLSQQFASAAALLAQRCAARVADGKFSTFVVTGREGLAVEPGGFLASPSLTAELLGSSLSGRDLHTQFPAVTGLLPEYDARPIQLAMFGSACH